jgi:hypothetical protein
MRIVRRSGEREREFVSTLYLSSQPLTLILISARPGVGK